MPSEAVLALVVVFAVPSAVLGWLTSTDGLCYLLMVAVLVADTVLAWWLFEASTWGARWYLWRRNRRTARQRRRR